MNLGPLTIVVPYRLIVPGRSVSGVQSVGGGTRTAVFGNSSLYLDDVLGSGSVGFKRCTLKHGLGERLVGLRLT